MDADGTIRLLGKILWNLPNLAGAACQVTTSYSRSPAREDPVARAQRGAAAARLWVGARNGPPALLGEVRTHVRRDVATAPPS